MPERLLRAGPERDERSPRATFQNGEQASELLLVDIHGGAVLIDLGVGGAADKGRGETEQKTQGNQLAHIVFLARDVFVGSGRSAALRWGIAKLVPNAFGEPNSG